MNKPKKDKKDISKSEAEKKTSKVDPFKKKRLIYKTPSPLKKMLIRKKIPIIRLKGYPFNI